MLNKVKLDYLLFDIVFYSLDCSLQIDCEFSKKEVKIFNYGKLVYIEDQFNFEDIKLSQSDYLILEKLHKLVFINSSIDVILTDKEVDVFSGFLKLIYYFTNEVYYTDKILDQHGRISIDNVDQSILKYLDFPVSDILIKILLKKFNLPLTHKFKVYLSCDYDILNYWDGINIIEKIKWFFYWIRNDIIEFKNQLKSYLKFCFKIENTMLTTDMFIFDTNSYDLSKIQFINNAFLLLPKRDRFFDNNIDFFNKFNKLEIDFLSEMTLKGVEFGIHPSIKSMEAKSVLRSQIGNYFTLFSSNPKLCRFHYLKIDYSKDLRKLEDFDIKEEHSFGFFDSILFRGGISKSFKMWDLSRSISYNVEIVPLSIMDTTIEKYLIGTNIQKMTLVDSKFDLIIKYGFQCSLLIHNNHFSMNSKYNIIKHQILLSFKRKIRFLNKSN